MTRKGEAHEKLSLLFHQDDVPPTMIFDCSKEQTMSNFKRKLREADSMVDRLIPILRGSRPLKTETRHITKNDQDRIT